MSKDKWLRVRLNDEQDEKLDRYCAVQGVSRSDLIREIQDLRRHAMYSVIKVGDHSLINSNDNHQGKSV